MPVVTNARSGMAHKVGVTLNNAPGTIDAGYEVVVYLNLINHSHKSVVLHKGYRVAQLIVDYRDFYNTRRRHQGLLRGKMHITPLLLIHSLSGIGQSAFTPVELGTR